MAGNNDDLLGMFAALQVADHIVADGIGQGLRGEEKSYAHRPLRDKRRNQIASSAVIAAAGILGASFA